MTNKTEELTARILAACRVPPRVTRAHIRAIWALREVLSSSYDDDGPTAGRTLVEMAQSLAAHGLKYGNDGEIVHIRVKRKGGHDCIVFTSDGVWLNVETLLDIVEDFGHTPEWWQYEWTEVRRGGVWITRSQVWETRDGRNPP